MCCVGCTALPSQRKGTAVNAFDEQRKYQSLLLLCSTKRVLDYYCFSASIAIDSEQQDQECVR
jgi:hypothetical protein